MARRSLGPPAAAAEDLVTLADIGRPRTTWAAAGGAAPSIVAIDPFGIFTEADPNLGTGAVQDSSWGEIGDECFFHFRIIFGSGSSPGVGFYAFTGMPRLPLLTGGNSRFFGSGQVLDASAGYRGMNAQVLMDPGVDVNRLIISVPGVWADVVVDAGTVTVLTPAAVPLVAHSVPFTFGDGDIINVSGQYQAVPA